MSALQILLYNKVQLDDGSQGIVRYMGNIMGKKGVFYGIDITKGDAKNDGTFKNIKYFDTKKGTRTGRFCKENKIVKCTKTTFSKYPFALGDTVMCTKVKCKGTVKYVGVPSWAKGGKVYYGLELQKKKGTSNGTDQGVQYFESKMNYGMYVASKGVKKVGGKKKKAEAMRDDYNSKPKEASKSKSIKKSKSKKKIKKNQKKSNKFPSNQPMANLMAYDEEYLVFGFVRNLKDDGIIRKKDIPKEIKTICVLFVGVIINLSKQKNIELNIHSYNGYTDSDHPQNLLLANDDTYYSKLYVRGNDWIIFGNNKKAKYYPTRVDIRGFRSYGNHKSTIRAFNIYIGDKDTDQWIKLNDYPFIAEKSTEYQSFKFDTSNTNKWIEIRNNQFVQYQLYILSNYGNQYGIIFTEFKLFGVEYN